MNARIQEADQYMANREGCYEYRQVRYRAAGWSLSDLGMDDSSTVFDIGAGWTELDYTLRTEFNWRGRYIPIDAGIDGTDLEEWIPKRHADFAVALELLEHLRHPMPLITRLQLATDNIIVSVPNPRTVDVLGIDPTHKTIITKDFLEYCGFEVQERTFYGGVFSKGEPDSLFATWSAR